MTSPSEPRTPRLYHAYDAPAAAKLAAGAIATLYVVQLVASALGAPDLVASGTSDLVVIGLLLAFAGVSGGVARLGLVRPRARFVVAGVLIGVSCWYPSLLLVTRLHPPGDTRTLERLTTHPPLGVTLVVLALLPAIAEELMFRGLLARGLATRMHAIWAILISAAAFGLYHVIPIQMIPTFLLGLGLGVMAVRGDSIVATMLAHALNNTVAILLSRDAVPAASTWIDGHPVATLATSLAVLATGVALAIPKAAA